MSKFRKLVESILSEDAFSKIAHPDGYGRIKYEREVAKRIADAIKSGEEPSFDDLSEFLSNDTAHRLELLKNLKYTPDEKLLAQHTVKEDWETDLDWKKFNPYGDDDDEEYEAWLENQDYYTLYAVYVGTSDIYGKLYAEYDEEWGSTNVLENEFDDVPHLWKTSEEAEKSAMEYKQAHPESDPKVVEVYSNEEKGTYREDKSDIYPYEKWEEDNYFGYDDYDDKFER